MDTSESSTSCYSNAEIESSKDDSSPQDKSPPLFRHHRLDDNHNRALYDGPSPRQPPCPAPRPSLEAKGQNVSKRSKVESDHGSSSRSDNSARQPPCPAPRITMEVKSHSSNHRSNHSPTRLEVKNSSPIKRSKVIQDDTSSTENTPERCIDNNEKSSIEKLRERTAQDSLKVDLKLKTSSNSRNNVDTSPQRSPSPRRRDTRSSESPSRSRSDSKTPGSPSAMRHAELPPVIRDPKSGEMYKRGRLLGKGGFARCYELVQVSTNRLYAGKIVPKARIAKPQQREKMDREICVHSKLNHPNVVNYHTHFEDEENIYIILELCSKKSLVQMLKLRHTFTEPEVRYFMQQIVEGVRYLHGHSVLHRDLKLGNMFLTDAMEVKIGDFGLAAKLEYEGDRKRTMCGTPNYIAPEVLGKIGHSFEADVWALGCIMYTMLVGRPPFETNSLKETYSRIKHNHYVLPENLSPAAKDLIAKLLTSTPEERPSLEGIVDHEFFTTGFIPEALSPTVVTTAPKFPITKVLISDSKGEIVAKEICRLHRESTLQRRDSPAPLSTLKVNNNNSPGPKSPVLGRHSSTPKTRNGKHLTTKSMMPVTSAIKNAMATVMDRKGVATLKCSTCPMSKVYDMLTTCLNHMPQAEYLTTPKYKPTSSELLWVIKWVDYSNKYGFGYQLSDRSVGVMFNDKSRICFTPNRRSVQYLSSEDKAHSFPMNSVPARLSKKVTLLDYFSTYMDEHLIKGPVQDIAGSPTSPIGNRVVHLQNKKNKGKQASQSSVLKLMQFWKKKLQGTISSNFLHQLPPQDTILNVYQNKMQLINLICQITVQKCIQLNSKRVIVVTGPDYTPIEVLDGNSGRRDDLKTTHEEADVIMVQQMLNLAFAGTSRIRVDDVDSVRSPMSRRRTHLQGSSSSIHMQPYLECWNRSNRAIGMYLSNGTLQVNFFEDHTKVILSYNNSDHLVTYINEERVATTYRLIHVAHHGCSSALYERLNYAQSVLLNMLGSANTNEKDESTNL